MLRCSLKTDQFLLHTNRRPDITQNLIEATANMAHTDIAGRQSSLTASKQIHNVRVYILALVASMGAVMFGYDLAFIGTSISLKSFQK